MSAIEWSKRLLGSPEARESCVCSPTTAASTAGILEDEFKSCAHSTDTAPDCTSLADERTDSGDSRSLLTAAVAATNCLQLLCSTLYRLASTPLILCVILCNVVADEWRAQRNRWQSWKESYTYFTITHTQTTDGPSPFLPLLWAEREMQQMAARQRNQRRWSCLYPVCRSLTTLTRWWVRLEDGYGLDSYLLFGVERRLQRSELCSLLLEKLVLRNVLFRSVVTYEEDQAEWLVLSAVGDNPMRIENHVFECANVHNASELLANSCARTLRPDLPLWHCTFCHAPATLPAAAKADVTGDVTGDVTLLVIRVHPSLGDKERLADSIGTSLFGPEVVSEQPLIVSLASVALLSLLAVSELVDMMLLSVRAMIFAGQWAADRCTALFTP